MIDFTLKFAVCLAAILVLPATVLAQQQSAEKESAEKESAEKESAEKESAEKESAEKESAEKESADKEAPPANFLRENLVAWCVVPFDSVDRSPQARAEMLAELGLTRCAYDWRERHVATFEDEILEYQRNNIEYFAFWGQHPKAYQLFQKYEMTPGIWTTLENAAGESQAEKLAWALELLEPLIEKTAAMNCKLGLYNHGGWGGEPANLVAICESLRAQGHDHVGIVYNFHHGHGDIAGFADSFAKMQPYLHCLNLNGMTDLNSLATEKERREQKIKPIGSGDLERQMIQSVIAAGYDGPVGVLGHVHERDVANVIRENVEGLEYLLGLRDKPDWLVQLLFRNAVDSIK